MPSPFPGMDPYLENPSGFPDFHHELISIIKQTLNDNLHPRYRARAEERVYVSREDDPGHRLLVPDISVKRIATQGNSEGLLPRFSAAVAEPIELVTIREEEIHESYLAIYDREGQQLVTVIEILSPSNKLAGSLGFESYRAKRYQVQHSATHLVEIDLLRSGRKMVEPEEMPPCDYYVHVSDARRRPLGRIWPILLTQPLPRIDIPLGGDDGAFALDLQVMVSTVYDRSYYRDEIDYAREPIPPLPSQYVVWANELLKSQNLR